MDVFRLCLHNRRKRGEVQGGLGMYLPKVCMGKYGSTLEPLLTICTLHSASARLSVRVSMLMPG